MGIKFTLDKELVKQYFAERLLFIATPYVPFDTGVLANSGIYVDGKIKYKTVYARRLYYDKSLKIKTRQHPKATSGWLDIATAENKKELDNFLIFLIKDNIKAT